MNDGFLYIKVSFEYSILHHRRGVESQIAEALLDDANGNRRGISPLSSASSSDDNSGFEFLDRPSKATNVYDGRIWNKLLLNSKCWRIRMLSLRMDGVMIKIYSGARIK